MPLRRRSSFRNHPGRLRGLSGGLPPPWRRAAVSPSPRHLCQCARRAIFVDLRRREKRSTTSNILVIECYVAVACSSICMARVCPFLVHLRAHLPVLDPFLQDVPSNVQVLRAGLPSRSSGRVWSFCVAPPCRVRCAVCLVRARLLAEPQVVGGGRAWKPRRFCSVSLSKVLPALGGHMRRVQGLRCSWIAARAHASGDPRSLGLV